MTIGQRIKERRRELHMSADKLAELIGKDRSTIFRYEKGDIENLPLDVLEPIAEALRTTPQYLMGWVTKKVSQTNDALTDIVPKLMNDAELLSLLEKLTKDHELLSTVVKLTEDAELLSMAEKIAKIDRSKYPAVISVLDAFGGAGE